MAKDQTCDGDYALLTDEDGIEDLLAVIERTCSCWERYDNVCPPSTVLDGDVIVYAFIAQPVWDGIVGAASAAPDVEEDWLAFIATARLDYPDEPAIQTALDKCADVVREWAD
jgi:hypothetical protein